MGFRLLSDIEARETIKERKSREEVNKEARGEVYVKCKKCEGTGLKFFRWGEQDEHTGWNGEFCESCGGTGYVDWLEPIIKGTGIIP